MKKELLAIVLFFLIVLTSVSLFSYDAGDPCLGNNFFDTPELVHNSFGLLGAHVAGFFIYLFGAGAFWLPLCLSAAGFWILKARTRKTLWLTFIGTLLLMICTGSLFAVKQETVHFFDTRISSGGITGVFLSAFLIKYANIAGCIIILIFFLLLSFILVTGVSLLSVSIFFKEKIVSVSKTMSEDFAEFIDYIRSYIRRVKQKREEGKKQIDIDSLPAADERPLKKIPEKTGMAEDPDDGDDDFPDLIEGQEISYPDPDSADFLKPQAHPAIVELEFDDSEQDLEFDFFDVREKKQFNLPELSFLDEGEKTEKDIDRALLTQKAGILEDKLKDFNVSGEVVEILPGPVITTFEYKPAPGIKISRIAGLSNDLALALSAISIRIVAPIPGKDVVGIEIPNEERENVNLRSLISSADFKKASSFLTLALGKDILGRPVITRMDKMPHLLIAGATGTGKSVGLNAMIISLLYKAGPDDIKMIMIDPKRIELSVYNDIPHLISPVVTDMKKATNALFWAVKEMERRYELLEQTGSRNIVQYNSLINKEQDHDAEDSEGIPPEKLPYIVVIIDELADLMMVASKDVEFALTRLAQMARAAGIHLIIATQRPSVDVLTGSIKANFPTRISFQVSSKVDARTIFDGGGSESLLGNGDMLFCPPGTAKLIRIQGAYISEKEIARVTEFLKEQQLPQYIEDITKGKDDTDDKQFDESDYDEKYDEAVALVTQTRQASISFVQRRLRIGYNRAARLIEIMEHEGIVGPQVGSKPREILVRSYDED